MVIKDRQNLEHLFIKHIPRRQYLFTNLKSWSVLGNLGIIDPFSTDWCNIRVNNNIVSSDTSMVLIKNVIENIIITYPGSNPTILVTRINESYSFVKLSFKCKFKLCFKKHNTIETVNFDLKNLL